MDQSQDQQLQQCDECDQLATWVRRTQFAGNHFFCTTHAMKEANFGQEDDSCFFWEDLPPTRRK
jgi:hypothetical protein